MAIPLLTFSVSTISIWLALWKMFTHWVLGTVFMFSEALIKLYAGLPDVLGPPALLLSGKEVNHGRGGTADAVSDCETF